MPFPIDQLHRFKRGAAHLNELGPRAITEFLVELASTNGCHQQVLERLAAYERITPNKLRVAGGHRFARRPIHLAATSE